MTVRASHGVVLVTGAASGIGAAVARALLASGRGVAAVDRDARGLDRLFEECGSGLIPRVLDLTDEPQVRLFVDELETSVGPITGLVNAAGVLPLGRLSVDALEIASFRHAFSVNVEAVWTMSRAVARHMVTRQSGSIVTVSSNAGTTPRIGMGAYCATKAAATMLTRCLGLELAESGIRCNVVSPGSTDTPMLRSLLSGDDTDRVISGDLATHRLGIPLGRIASPLDVAHVVAFLLSDQSRHVTLQDLRVDGGATL